MSRESELRVALVTGGSRGIGRAVAEALLAEGWRVFLCSASEASVGSALRELGAAYPGRVAGRMTDVRRQQQVEELVAWVLAEAGRLDCLVNNAGLGIFGPVDEISGGDWRKTLDTNLSGPFYATRAAVPAMKRQGSGWILNIVSLAGRSPFAGGAAYNASKFGLVGFSEASMLDLRRHGIRVAAILPGSVETDFGAGRMRTGGDWRLQPEDVARAVTDLLRYPDRALPSRVELRPSRPPAK